MNNDRLTGPCDVFAGVENCEEGAKRVTIFLPFPKNGMVVRGLPPSSTGK